jgi:hypothetical protein
VITILAPNPDYPVVVGSTLRYEFFVTDDVRPVQATIYVNGEEFSTMSLEGPTNIERWVQVPAGDSVRLQARAVDSRGLVGYSEILTIGTIANLPPTVSITSPPAGVSRLAGESIQIQAVANDDHGVSYVQFAFDGQDIGLDYQPPYTLDFTLPLQDGPGQLTATAVDLYGLSVESQPVLVDILPDPGTTVIGQVVDTAGNPVAGASITIGPDFAGTSGTDGRFSIMDVTAARALVVAWIAKDDTLIGYAPPEPPVRDGETDLGIVVLRRLDSLEASWPFSGNAFDTTGNLHHGTVVGATLTSDRFGKPDSAYRFSQATGLTYIQAGDMVVPAASFTYTAWIKLDAFPTEPPAISHIMGVDGPGGTGVLRLGDAGLAPDILNFVLNDSRVVGTTPLATGTWYFVAATLGQGTATIYVDGNVEATEAGVSLSEASGAFLLGNGVTGGFGDRGLRGTIDDARFYRRALSPAEIQTLYQQGGWPP